MRADPTPAARRRLAFLYLQVGRFTDALPIYQEIASAPDADPGSLVNLGLTKASLGDDPGAIDAYRGALALDPSILQARLDLGVALYRSGDESGAKEALAAYLAAAGKGESAERVRKFLTALGWRPPSPEPSGGLP